MQRGILFEKRFNQDLPVEALFVENPISISDQLPCLGVEFNFLEQLWSASRFSNSYVQWLYWERTTNQRNHFFLSQHEGRLSVEDLTVVSRPMQKLKTPYKIAH